MPREIHDGEPIFVQFGDITLTKDDEAQKGFDGEVFKLVCCDCSLVHRVGIARNIETGELIMLFQRDDRSTGQRRRREQGGLFESDGKWKIVRND